MIRALLLAILSIFTCQGFCQQVTWYNTDSLLADLSRNEKINQILLDASSICKEVQLDTANISLAAFKLAYLEKRMIDERKIRIKHRRWYRNKNIISIVDYTKKGNLSRFAILDLKNRKLLFDTLVSQGSGKQPTRNDKYHIPTYFSNTVNSEVSSLGMIVTQKARQTKTPCHLCKYAATQKHKDVIVLRGIEKGINDHVKKRDIVMHTTGSADLGVNTIKELGVRDANYTVKSSECKCYRTVDGGNVKGIAAYASTCGLAENGGYMGQSNGCLVLPEECHIGIMEVVKQKSLIFIYSNVETGDYSYFRDSPIILKILKYSKK
ncbi:MAG: hypothetical protein K0Q79_3396 [Flavipsychrobacter sp.]|jgi:hypothetical protein|nr:hypothetical protein [Flavipsychrobacter sp.]